MAVWSSLKSTLGKWSGLVSKNVFSVESVRNMSGGHHRIMEITPSRFQWKKTKDLLHFYALLGLIPIGLLIFYTNVFIGPAKLAPIPENYTPKHWEYFKHPITRWMARYIYPSPQQEYEKYLHQLYEEDEKMKLKALTKKVHSVMEQKKDYQAFYYIPVDGKYYRIMRKSADENVKFAGVSGPVKGP